MWTLTDPNPRPIPLADYPVSAGQVIGTAFEDAIDNNPVPLVMQAFELNRLKNLGPKLPKDQATAEAARMGVKVSIPQDGMTLQALQFFEQRRKDDIAKSMVFSRSPGGVVATGGQFAAGFAGTLFDPVNLAAGFIPVLGGTKYAAALEKAGSAAARAGVRAAVGAGEGAVGAVAVEIPTATLRGDLQDDYTLLDSLANIAFGTFASAGLRAGGGALNDAYLGLDQARRLDALRAIEPEVWERMRQASTSAEERTFFSDLEVGTTRGGGLDDMDVSMINFNREFGEATERALAVDREAEAAVDRRMLRKRDEMLAAGMEPDEALREAFRDAHPETAKALKSQSEIGAERAAQYELDAARKRIESGAGLVHVPRTAAEIEAAISGETHAAALRASVAQAIDGRRVDPTAIVRQDPVFGAQRLSPEETKLMAEADQRPENKVAADKNASARADETLKLSPKEVKPLAVGEPADLAELQRLTTDAERQAKAALPEGKDLPEMKDRSIEYEKAWKAVADCLEGKV